MRSGTVLGLIVVYMCNFPLVRPTTVTVLASEGREWLAAAPFDVNKLRIAKRFFQAHYRLVGTYELRQFYVEECLAVYSWDNATKASYEDDEWQGWAEAKCKSFDQSPEAWLAETELRLKGIATHLKIHTDNVCTIK